MNIGYSLSDCNHTVRLPFYHQVHGTALHHSVASASPGTGASPRTTPASLNFRHNLFGKSVSSMALFSAASSALAEPGMMLATRG